MANQNLPRQITVSEMAPHVHSFVSGENKVNKISEWLINWIKKSLAKGRIKQGDFLPTKGDLAFHIGVSKGTMQNAFRKVEDFGLLVSKQKIGTCIGGANFAEQSSKLTSKRDSAVEKIKQYIVDCNLKIGDVLPSIRKIAAATNISNSTVRMAIESLVISNILYKKECCFIVNSIDFEINNLSTKTLVDKVAEKIKVLIATKVFTKNKFPTNTELANEFNVSVKTVHDAIKILCKEGILRTRRGRYGTQVASDEKNDNELYYYERIEIKIKHYISSNCEVGTKLPSIVEFAKHFHVSSKTIKKALDNLAYEGYITFTRGRNGGTFVTDIPQDGSEAYKWLAINPQFINASDN